MFPLFAFPQFPRRMVDTVLAAAHEERMRAAAARDEDDARRAEWRKEDER